MIEQHLEQLIEQKQFSQKAELVKPLPSDTNECWLIHDSASPMSQQLPGVEQQNWVVKRLRHDELSVDWQTLVDNSLQAEKLGLTPPLVFHSENAGSLIFPYREEGVLAQADWPKSEKIELLAKTLAKIHESGMSFQPMDLYQEVERYLRMLKSVTDQTQYLSEMAKLPALPESNYFVSSDAYCPCHMDLSFENLMVNGEVLDWEYARQALPLIDLASCASINELSQGEALQLFENYNDCMGFSESKEFFEIYCKWSDLLNRIWYQVAEQNTERDFSTR